MPDTPIAWCTNTIPTATHEDTNPSQEEEPLKKKVRFNETQKTPKKVHPLFKNLIKPLAKWRSPPLISKIVKTGGKTLRDIPQLDGQTVCLRNLFGWECPGVNKCKHAHVDPGAVTASFADEVACTLTPGIAKLASKATTE